MLPTNIGRNYTCLITPTQNSPCVAPCELNRLIPNTRYQRGQDQPLLALRSTLQSAPKGEALSTDYFRSANKPLAQKTPSEESSPKGEAARRAEEVTIILFQPFDPILSRYFFVGYFV
jgi:hypothetical protein